MKSRGLPIGLMLLISLSGVCALSWLSPAAESKEIALSFDDAPFGSTAKWESTERSRELIRKLKKLGTPPVMIFANPCKGSDAKAAVAQLKLYRDAGHRVGNHTCSHPRLDETGFDAYAADAAQGDRLLAPLLGLRESDRFFRFPYLNEGTDPALRDRMRAWLKTNRYRNGHVSIDTDDYLFSFKLKQAFAEGKNVEWNTLRELFLEHVLGAAEFYDRLALITLGRSPKHVLLLHEMDATVLFVDALVTELRKHGWKIIGIDEAYSDPLYLEKPDNTYANNGIIAQLAFEKTGEKTGYSRFEELKARLNLLLGIKK